MSNAHILLMFHHYRTPRDLGGLRSWHIGNALSEAGFDVTAVVPGVDTLTNKRHPALGSKPWVEEKVGDVSVIRVNATNNDRTSKPSRVLYYSSISVLQGLAALTTGRCDVVLSTSMPLGSMALAWALARLKGAAFCIDVRDLTFDAAIELGYFKEGLLPNVALALERWLYRRADQLIPVSQGLGDILMSHGADPDRVEVVRIGFDGEEAYAGITDESRDIRKELGLEGKFIALYAGSLGHVFNIPVVLDAARHTLDRDDVVFVFVGTGQRLEEYKKLAADEGLHCVFVGAVPKSDIPLYCSQSDVAVYPLKGGPVIAALLGNKIYDYFGGGLPTVFCGPHGDVCKLIERTGAGVCVNSGDSRALADAILDLESHRDRLAKMSRLATKSVDEHYHVRFGMERLVEIIDSVVRGER